MIIVIHELTISSTDIEGIHACLPDSVVYQGLSLPAITRVLGDAQIYDRALILGGICGSLCTDIAYRHPDLITVHIQNTHQFAYSAPTTPHSTATSLWIAASANWPELAVKKIASTYAIAKIDKFLNVVFQNTKSAGRQTLMNFDATTSWLEASNLIMLHWWDFPSDVQQKIRNYLVVDEASRPYVQLGFQ